MTEFSITMNQQNYDLTIDPIGKVVAVRYHNSEKRVPAWERHRDLYQAAYDQQK